MFINLTFIIAHMESGTRIFCLVEEETNSSYGAQLRRTADKGGRPICGLLMGLKSPDRKHRLSCHQ